jgi:hypothetical protein
MYTLRSMHSQIVVQKAVLADQSNIQLGCSAARQPELLCTAPTVRAVILSQAGQHCDSQTEVSAGFCTCISSSCMKGAFDAV